MPTGTIDPLYKIRQRKHNGNQVRFIKVREDGPPGRRWISLAKFTWEELHGPVPRGYRVVHADGNTLNDAPDNLVLMTPGQVAQLCHALDPEMSEDNRRKCREATVETNRLRGRINRTIRFLTTRWYPVDPARGVVYNDPFRSRKALLVAYGFRASIVAPNGRLYRPIPFVPTRGEEIGREFEKREPPLDRMICVKCGCHQFDACWHEELGSCYWVMAGLCSACASDTWTSE